MADSLREDLEAAFEQHDTPSAAPETTSEQVVDTTPAEPAAEGTSQATEGGSSAGEEVSPLVSAAPVEGQQPAAPEGASEVSPTAAPAIRAPGSWTPEAREFWAKLPPEVQKEVDRREREVSRALTASADARKFHQEFDRSMQPFLGFIAAENSTPMQAVQHMMQTAAALRVGTPAQKAQLVAQTIKNFGVDLRMLDGLLAGQSVADDPATQVDRIVQQRLAPIMERFQQADHASSVAMTTKAQQELDAFAADPKNEFFNDVRDLVADIIELGYKNGQSVSLTDAYARATLIHEPTRRVIEARRSREAAQQKTVVAQAAMRTAASVAPSAAVRTTQTSGSDSLRGAIERSIEQLQGQGR